MRLTKLFSLIQSRLARRSRRSSTYRRTSWPVSAATESLETRCLLSAGDLDPTFGVGGRVTTSFGNQDQARSVAIQSDGKIVVAGTNSVDFALARYNSDGSLDLSFDGDGKLTTDFGTPNDSAYSVAMQADGKIVVAGRTSTNDGTSLFFALARYNSNGSLDTSFGGSGKLTADFGGTHRAFANSMVVQADGKIVVVGFTSNGGKTDFALVRFNTDGGLDTSFDSDGKVTTSIGTSSRAIAHSGGYRQFMRPCI